jgi:RNA-directed DNA polymerase
VSLETPEKVRKLQMALHAKAKGSPSCRFYLLVDRMHREDILAFAYRLCRANGGAAGVDGQSFADLEGYGVERWLGALTEELREKTYRPQAVRRVWIPKPDGKPRPLGIPTIRDRVVQTAAVLVLEPIFEADLPDEQFGYRPNRSALDAVRKVHALLNTGHHEVRAGPREQVHNVGTSPIGSENGGSRGVRQSSGRARLCEKLRTCKARRMPSRTT